VGVDGHVIHTPDLRAAETVMLIIRDRPEKHI
jgi:hypothetical protein